MTDAEVTYFLTKNSSVRLAAALACRGIAAKLARRVNYSLGELSESLNQKMKGFLELAKELEATQGRYSFTSVVPTVGVVTDSGTMPSEYAVSGEKVKEWSLDRSDMPDEYRGVDSAD